MTSFQKRTISFIIIATGLCIGLYLRMSNQKSCTRAVADENTLLVGTAAEFPPFEFIKDDKVVGFDIDLVHEIAQRMGKKIVMKDMPFVTLIPQTQRGSLHMIAAGLTPTPERAQQLLFTKPYLESDPLVVVTLVKNPKIHSIDDLKGKTVIVNEGFSAEKYMAAIPGVHLQRLPTVADAFLSLTSGRADAFVVAENNIKPFFKQYSSDNFSLYVIPHTNEQSAFAVSKKYPELFENIQHVLDQLLQEGFIETLKRKWDIA